MVSVADLVAKNARLSPGSTAFVEVRALSGERREITWSAFNKRMNKVAHVLAAKGIGKGMRVALLGRNSIDWLEAFFGIIETGAWVIPLSFRFTDTDIKYCADIGEPNVFILDEEFASRVGAMRPGLPTVASYMTIGGGGHEGMERLEPLMEHASGAAIDVDLSSDDECALYFTSGTTGAPKAVLHAHRSLMVSAITEATNHNWTAGDRQLMMSPLYHLAIGHLLGGVIKGGSNVLLTELIKPQIIISTLAKERATMVFLLVPWALDILGAFDRGEIRPEEYDLTNLRLVHMGAQPIPQGLIRRWKSYFPSMVYDTTYGLSEGGGPGVTNMGTQDDEKMAP